MTQHTLIIDSGVGGLNVVKSLKENKINGNFVYVADQKNIPYGRKNDEELFLIVKDIILSYQKNYFFKDVILACNTLCTTIYELLKLEYPNLTFHSISHYTKDLIDNTTEDVCVLSTLTTHKSNFFISSKNKKILSIPLNNMVDIIEREGSEREIYDELFNRIEITTQEISSIKKYFLCCTHYNFIKDKIEYMLTDGVEVIDPSNFFAKKLKVILPTASEFNILYESTSENKNTLYKFANKVGISRDKSFKKVAF